ncbi:amino acid ABC transporter, permease protein [Richelia intracellularis HH01]|uniref:Amino acid ABC transporter, permease protein n=1 Tax=Richelia intracellularis HH01 TaxID=1165094 RepID=M1X2U4_9NOST|nr:amino acid ABC transporter permease [Richelia intracellularis]CCH67430.1 amino acid ABC transporter, permease protein [Richelia intracellularis HH01]HAE05539.1 amino acid ABC transporter permease [Richelia sp.]
MANLESVLQNSKLLWLRKNLFSNWYNTLFTILCLVIIVGISKGLCDWIFNQAKWEVVQANLHLFLVGRYIRSQYWRLWNAFAIVSVLIGINWGVFTAKERARTNPVIIVLITSIILVITPLDINSRLWLLGINSLSFVGMWLGRKFTPIIAPWLFWLWLISFPIIMWLIGGEFYLQPIGSDLWNGLLLTVLMAIASIVLSFPIGILLALGRTSTLPIWRWFCTSYIEIVRGLPLIGILFLAQFMLTLFLPLEWRLDRVMRAIIGLVLFSSAYMAENIRGGLQAVPKGQAEAAKALGLKAPLIVGFIILPQALRTVIPAIVGQFIGLFKDTCLLSLVGLAELTRIARSILAQPQFLGQYAEVYLFIGLVYWLFCYFMSLVARRLERQLNIGS